VRDRPGVCGLVSSMPLTKKGDVDGECTFNMAFLTRSEVMRPLLARFLIRAALEEPEDIQAIASGSTGGKGGTRAGEVDAEIDED